MPAISTGLALGLAGIGAAGSIGGAAFAGHAAGKAAQTQANASIQAAQIQAQSEREALDFQRQVLGIQESNIAPWLSAGRGALVSLSNLLGLPDPIASLSTRGELPAFLEAAAQGNPGGLGPEQGMESPSELTNLGARRGGFEGGLPRGVPLLLPGDARSSLLPSRPLPLGIPSLPQRAGGPSMAPGARGSLLAPFGEQFAAPTNVTEANDPGFQFRLRLGQEALERSAAARGGLLSGATGRALTSFAQDYASNEYQNVYNRALTEYQQRYNIFEQNQAKQFNRLAAMAGVGQTSAGQLNAILSQGAGNVGNLLLGFGRGIAGDIASAGAARASGYAAGGNIWGNALTGATGDITNMILLSQLLGKKG